MQPYFFPYIGYFQLINAVDEFVIYDNIEYTKKGWINRNRIIVNGTDAMISLPLKKDSDYKNVNQRYLSNTWSVDRKKMLNKVLESYRKAPQFEPVYALFEKCLMIEESNLFDFIHYSLKEILQYLSISTKIKLSSSIEIDHQLKSEEKVLAICKAENATTYINPIGGMDLYNKEAFNNEGISLQFLKSEYITYPQFNNDFVPFLSIIDVLMFNTKDEIINKLRSFTLN